MAHNSVGHGRTIFTLIYLFFISGSHLQRNPWQYLPEVRAGGDGRIQEELCLLPLCSAGGGQGKEQREKQTEQTHSPRWQQFQSSSMQPLTSCQRGRLLSDFTLQELYLWALLWAPPLFRQLLPFHYNSPAKHPQPSLRPFPFSVIISQ